MSEEERKLVEKNIVFEDTLLEITPELMKKTILKQDKEIEKLRKLLRYHQYVEEIKFKEICTRDEIIEEKDKEIERLNNIIKELKKGIENMYVDDAGEDIWEYEEEYLYREEFLDKIEELKGVDKE